MVTTNIKQYGENPVLAGELHCTREIGNPHDPAMAVVIQNQISGEMVIIGHVPKRISALSSVSKKCLLTRVRILKRLEG